MPRRSKLPKGLDYEGIPQHPDNMLVQKSNPLKSLSETNMTLAEFKILDAYLSRIDSHKPEKRYVCFEIGEFEKLLNVTQIRKEDLLKRLKNLFQVVTIDDPNKPNGVLISLFAKAEYAQDKHGLWQVGLACSEEAMEYIFNIENLGFIKYRLKNIVDLTSRYSYVLYLYLESNRFRKSWTISIDDLKTLLRCTADTYTDFRRFNDLILKKCHKELNNKTSLKFSYETIKNGRRVTDIQFTIDSESYEEFEQLTMTSLTTAKAEEPDFEIMSIKYGSEQLAQLADSLNYEFTKEQMDEIFSILRRINVPRDINTNSVHWGRVLYLREKYAALNIEDAKKAKKGQKIKNRYAYLKKMLEQDTFTPAAVK